MRRSHALLIVTAPVIVVLAALYAVRSASAPVALPAPVPAPPAAPAAPGPQAGLPLAPEPELAPAPARVTLVAVGDIMLSRTVGKTIAAKGDVRYPFLRMRDWLRGADIAFANLETSITPGRAVEQGEMLFRADPRTVDGLVDAGFDVLSLANNHTPNFGQKGLRDTFRYLHDAGIAFAGAGEDAAAARAPTVLERGGRRFAFLAFNDTDVVPASYAAGPAHAGTAFMDVDVMAEAVRDARKAADVVIVSMHSGREYAYVPDASQVRFARAAIDAGADLVIGHHPHVVQTVERYKDKLIFYSLGNFVFDQMWSEPTREGLAVKFTFEGPRVVRADLLPVRIEDYAQPHPSNGEIAGRTLARLTAGITDRPAWRWDAPSSTFVPVPWKTLASMGGFEDAVGQVTADIDGDGGPETVAVENPDPAVCETRVIVVRKKAPDGAETEVWRSPPGCYADAEVERLDGGAYLTADLGGGS